MLSIKRIILFLAVFQIVSSFCGTGCLKCGTNDQCVFCDPYRGLYLQSSNCIRTTKTGCKIVDIEGNCLNCSQNNYYVDLVTKNCVQVPNAGLVANCIKYSGPSSCMACEKDYFLQSANQCIAVTTTIADCATYATVDTCKMCSANFIKTDLTTCTARTNDNCNVYTQLKCLECKTGYRQEQFYGLRNLSDRGFTPSSATDILNAMVLGGLVNVPFPTCYKTDNCEKYSSEDFSCSLCVQGYYLNPSDKSCVQNPLTKSIDHCAIYLTQSTCSKCDAGFILKSPILCILAPVIEGCQEYDNTGSFPICAACSGDYYKIYESICQKRLLSSINNCANLKKDSDGCQECDQGYILRSDKARCLPQILNCMQYDTTTSTTTALTCSKCNNGYYYLVSSRTCSQGTVANCETYQQSANTCETCENGYRLQGSACQSIPAIVGCVNYSRTDANNCLQCVTPGVKYKHLNECQAVTPIANCETYSSLIACNLCQHGYKPIGSNQCSAVSFPNCVKFHREKCIQCSSGHIFSDTKSQCIPATELDKTNCFVKVMHGTNTGDSHTGCETCNNGSGPFDFQNGAYCIADSILQSANSGSLIANCMFYVLNNTTYECRKCDATYYLSGGDCVLTCDSPNAISYYEITENLGSTGTYSLGQNIKHNVCKTATVTNCKNETPQSGISGTTFSTNCVKCRTGSPFVTVTGTSSMRHVISSFNSIPAVTSLTKNSIVPSINSCETGQTIKGTGVTSGTLPSCAYYYDIPNFSEKACLQCNWGKTGVVKISIPNCYSYTDSTTKQCSQCIKGFNLSADTVDNSCNSNDEIVGCIKFDGTTVGTSCWQCELETHYHSVSEDLGTCTSRTVTSDACTLYDRDADACLTCAGTHILVSGNCYTKIDNCLQYEVISDPNYRCTLCNTSTHYLDQTQSPDSQCVSGGITNCELYAAASANSAICLKCTTSNILSKNACYSSPISSGTSGFCVSSTTNSFVTSVTCDICSFDSFLFNISQTCQTPSMTGCDTFSSFTECSKCASTYYIETVGTCASIDAALNCAILEPVDANNDNQLTTADYNPSNKFTTTCTQCNTGYYRVVNSSSVSHSGGSRNIDIATCIQPTQSIGDCTTGNTSGTAQIDDITCPNGCESNFTPYLFSGAPTCVDQNYLSETGNTPITDCDIHYFNGSTLECTKCVFDRFANSSKTACSSSCNGSSEYPVAFSIASLNTDPQKIRISSFGSCKSTSVSSITGCKLYAAAYAFQESDIGNAICVRCNDGHFPVISLNAVADINGTENFSYYKADHVFENSYEIGTYLTPHNQIQKCQTLSGTTIKGASIGVLLDDCDQYGYITSTSFGCVRCKNGYTSVVEVENSAARGYLKSCTSLSGASSSDTINFQQDKDLTTVFGSLRTLFSITTCPSNVLNTVPFLFLEKKVNSDFKILGYSNFKFLVDGDLSGSESTLKARASSETESPEVLQCISVDSSASDNIQKKIGNNKAGDIVDDCGLYVVNTIADLTVSSNKASDIGQRALFCVACKPGFHPSYKLTNGPKVHFIVSCEKITVPNSIDNGSSFNINDNCPFRVTDLGSGIIGPNYSTCEITVTNCFLADTTGTLCKVCKPGYSLNAARNACFLLGNSASCSAYQLDDPFPIPDSLNAGTVTIAGVNDSLLVYYALKTHKGCTDCQADRKMVFTQTTTKNPIVQDFCVKNQSPTVIDVSTSPYNTENCEKHGFDRNASSGESYITCFTCSSEYVRSELTSSNKRYCFAQTVIPNCSKVQVIDSVTRKCLECIDSTTHMVINNACTTIPDSSSTNCKTYDLTASASASNAKCSVCNYGYTLNNGTCDPISNSVTNCGVESGSTCSQCMPGYVLIGSGSSLRCMKVVNGNTNLASTTLHDTNCLILDSAQFRNKKLVCSVCSGLMFPASYTATNSETTNYCYKYQEYTATNCAEFYSNEPVLNTSTDIAVNCLKCNNYSTHFLTEGACSERSNSVTECRAYSQTADECSGCNAGFNLSTSSCSPVPVGSNTDLPDPTATNLRTFLDNSGGYIDQCSTNISDCVTSTYYQGLEAPANRFFSCHVCSTSPNIPFAFIDGGETTYTGVRSLWSFSNTNSTASGPIGYYQGGNSIQCLNPTADQSTTFSASNAYENKLNLPTYCALGFVNVRAVPDASQANQITNIDKTKIGVFCAACKPMYAPASGTDTNGDTIPHYVGSCTLISNCASSTTFNSCDACSSNFNFVMSGNSINFRSCVSSNAQNCMAVKSSDNQACHICNSGYYVNPDGVCETFQITHCSQNGQFENNLAGIQINEVLIIQPFTGCAAGCDGGYLALQKSENKLLCKTSAYIVEIPSSSKYTANCQNYLNKVETNGNILCSICKNSYILTTTDTCITTTDAHCLKPVNSSICEECAQGYYLVSSICTFGNIPNCSTYESENSNVLTCTKCYDHHFLFKNTCPEGQIPNCKEYDEVLTCSVCEAGYGLRKTYTGATECVPLRIPVNCDVLDATSLDNFQISCQTCSEGYFPSVFSSSQQFDSCFTMSSKENCMQYEIGTTFENSSFLCTRCTQNYYLNRLNNVCIPRTSISLSNCNEADIYSDVCLIPSAISSSGSSGTSNTPTSTLSEQPKVPKFCVRVDSSFNCIQCDQGKYWSGNACVSLTVPLISNCQVYNSTQHCIECQGSHYLNNNECPSIQGQNCDKFDHKGGCLTCQPNHGLYYNNGVNTCVVLSIQDCIKYSPIYPFDCTQCSTGKYLNNKLCADVNTAVANCNLYSGNGICSRCNENFSLVITEQPTSDTDPTLVKVTTCSETNTLAVSTYADLNCSNFAYEKHGTCLLCNSGFILVNGECVQANSGANCLITDYNDYNKCLLCASGFYQNNNRKCVSDTTGTSTAQPQQQNLLRNGSKKSAFSGVQGN